MHCSVLTEALPNGGLVVEVGGGFDNVTMVSLLPTLLGPHWPSRRLSLRTGLESSAVGTSLGEHEDILQGLEGGTGPARNQRRAEEKDGFRSTGVVGPRRGTAVCVVAGQRTNIHHPLPEM